MPTRKHLKMKQRAANTKKKRKTCSLVVFYKSTRNEIWPQVREKGVRIPCGLTSGGFEGTLHKSMLQRDLTTEAWYTGPRTSLTEMKKYLTVIYNKYKIKRYCNTFVICEDPYVSNIS